MIPYRVDPKGVCGAQGVLWCRSGARVALCVIQALAQEGCTDTHTSLFFVIMGSAGWVRCYWCEYWVYNPYIIDWVGHPLCDWCYDWHVYYDGGPYEPTARQRTASRLQLLFAHVAVGQRGEQLPASSFDNIAAMLREWHEP